MTDVVSNINIELSEDEMLLQLELSEEHGLVNIPKRRDYPIGIVYDPDRDFIVKKVNKIVAAPTPRQLEERRRIEEVSDFLSNSNENSSILIERMDKIKNSKDTNSRFKLLTPFLKDIQDKKIIYSLSPSDLLSLLTNTDLTSKATIDSKLEIFKLLTAVTFPLVSPVTRSFILLRFLIESPEAKAKRLKTTIKSEPGYYAIPVAKISVNKAYKTYLIDLQNVILRFRSKVPEDDVIDLVYIKEFNRILDRIDWPALSVVKQVEFIKFVVDLFTRGLSISQPVYETLIDEKLLEQYQEAKGKTAPAKTSKIAIKGDSRLDFDDVELSREDREYLNSLR